MKKSAVFTSIAALLAVAGSAFAQTGAAAAARLELRIVPVNTSTGANGLNLAYQGDTQHDTVAVSDALLARQRRFEVQFRIVEGAGFEGFIASLASFQMNITASLSNGTLSTIGFDRAVLTLKQARSAPSPSSLDAVGATDTSGNATGPNAGKAGLHNVWRGGMSPSSAAGNTLPSNGILLANGIGLVTPLTLSEQGATAPSNDVNAWYGLYSFNVTVGDATPGPGPVTVNLTAAAVADAQTGNAWGAYEFGDPIPRTSINATAGHASFDVEAIPAPGAVALMGLGGLLVARRRRA
jgi:hypothetical protein